MKLAIVTEAGYGSGLAGYFLSVRGVATGTQYLGYQPEMLEMFAKWLVASSPDAIVFEGDSLWDRQKLVDRARALGLLRLVPVIVYSWLERTQLTSCPEAHWVRRDPDCLVLGARDLLAKLIELDVRFS